ncbi:hypothetical protein GUITHDRAFT_120449 [Guillardia theta CCMP2712]|uniref:Cyclic nucleotide-binding domain-containing protein n=1 Tax=Guillardia theta (strain CCMP2712) TaxID=905079 RepID=L1IC21_GUITC|nr:hypothetical protein GUITHDRAFT_120449 [Guillardia theta CCMP2712]EKX33385.1 hypothetical protein GUITHDRAFT_120449 [Guillardia theta CCMP2712]|eukprot:XP_005820365.1 hypothetical protein GUITHDRAFT_120449 [Guillardia theta CCMP2712]
MLSTDADSEYNHSFIKMFFGIGPRSKRLPSSKLIHPNSPYTLLFSGFMGLLLLYTAINTPVTVAFFWDSNACTSIPTLNFDIFVDTFFICDILNTFFIGVHHQGRYIDDLKWVFFNYLRTNFVFDTITSFPVSYVEVVMLSTCPVSSNLELSPNALRIIRVMKPLRLFKIFRIVKVVKTFKLMDTLGNRFRVPPRIMRLSKLFASIGLMVHLCSCLYWLVKVTTNSNEEVSLFIQSKSMQEGIDDEYTLSFYFVTTIFTTIGFGDVYAENHAERVYCIVVMYLGSLVFGILLAEVQQIVNQWTRQARNRDNHVQAILDFLRKNEIPFNLENEVVHWASFDFEETQRSKVQNEVLNSLPMKLRRNLLHYMHKGTLNRISIFSGVVHPSMKELILDIWAALRSVTYYYGSIICDSTTKADRLIIISTGVAQIKTYANIFDLRTDVAFNQNSHGTKLFDLNPGDYIGEYALLGDTDWGASYNRLDITCESMTRLMCLVLTKSAFDELIANYPPALKEELHARGQKHITSTLSRTQALRRSSSNILMEARRARVENRWFSLTMKLRLVKESSSSTQERFARHLSLHALNPSLNDVLKESRRDNDEFFFSRRKQDSDSGIKIALDSVCDSEEEDGGGIVPTRREVARHKDKRRQSTLTHASSLSNSRTGMKDLADLTDDLGSTIHAGWGRGDVEELREAMAGLQGQLQLVMEKIEKIETMTPETGSQVGEELSFQSGMV